MLDEVKESKNCVGISFKGFEEQFWTLLIAIESSRSLSTKVASKRDRELKRLTCSINSNMKECNVGRGRSKGRVTSLFL